MKRLGPAAVATSLLLGGCGTANEPDARSSPTPHGYVEGAEEAAEPQWRLVHADGDGTIGSLHPVDEKTTELASVKGVDRLDTDGRFVFAVDGSSATVIDSGVWTVDHGDHRHYYRAEPRKVGTVGAGEDLTVVGDSAVTVLNSAAGVIVLDRPALEDGKVKRAAKLTAAAALPFGEKLVAADSDGTVEVLGRTGDSESRLDASCQGARHPAVTKRGAVFACDDGALLISGTDGEIDAEMLPYPDSGGIEGGFQHRSGTPVLGAMTDDGTALVLDVADKNWTELDAPAAVAVAGTGEDMPVLVLTEDGKLRSFDAGTGKPDASKSIMDPIGGADTTPVIEVDTARAYVTDPKNKTVYEIDYADELRVARELKLETSPEHLVETGW